MILISFIQIFQRVSFNRIIVIPERKAKIPIKIHTLSKAKLWLGVLLIARYYDAFQASSTELFLSQRMTKYVWLTRSSHIIIWNSRMIGSRNQSNHYELVSVAITKACQNSKWCAELIGCLATASGQCSLRNNVVMAAIERHRWSVTLELVVGVVLYKQFYW